MQINPSLLLAACAAIFVPSAPEAGAESPTSREAAPEVLRTWVDARAGTGAPVFWLAEGGVYAYPSGEKLLGMIGFDASTAIYHLLSWRVESHDEFPPALLEWARRDAPMWLQPPADLDEIRALQTGAPVGGWPE